MKQKSNKIIIAAAVALTLALGAGTTYNAVVNSKQQKEIDALQATRENAADEIYTQTKEYLTSYVSSDSYVKTLQSNDSFAEAVENSSTAILTDEQIESIVEIVTEAAKEMLLNDDILEGTTSLKAYDLQYVKELIKDEVTSNIGKEIEILADDCITQADINEMMNKLYARLDDQMKEAMSVDINNLIVQELQSLTSGMVLTQAEKDAFMQDIENTVYNELLEMGIGGNGTVTTLSLTNAQVKQLVNQLTEKVSKPVKGKDYLTETEVNKMTDTVVAIVEANVLASLRADSTDSINTIKSDLNTIKNEIDGLSDILADIQNGDMDVYLADGTKTNIADLDEAVKNTLDDAAKIKADQEALEKNIKSLTDGDVVGKLDNIESIGGEILPGSVAVPGKYGKTNLEATLNWLNSRLDLKDYSINADQVTYKDTNVESALNDYLDRSKELQEGLYIIDKNLGLANASDKDASIDKLLEYLSTNISSGSGNGTVVNTKDATAKENEILYGKTAYVNGEKKTGTMPNNGSVTQSLNAGDTFTIPKGYHDGTGIITANGLAGQTSGTATEDKMLQGYTAWVNGAKVTGSMPNNGALNKSGLTAGASYTIPAGYTTGGTVTAASLASQTGVDSGKTAVTSNQMLQNYQAWVNGTKVTGSIPSLGANTYTPGTTNQTITSGQYLSGAQTIKGDSNLIAANIVSGKKIFGVTGTAVIEVDSAAHSVPTGKTAATAPQVLSGKYIWNGSSWLAGTMKNKSNSTTTATDITESADQTNALIKIPEAGYYDTNSELQVPIETIKNNCSSLNSSMTITLTAGGTSDNAGNSWCGGSISVPNIGYQKLTVISGSIIFNGTTYSSGDIINITNISTISVNINGFQAHGISGSVTSSSASATIKLS